MRMSREAPRLHVTCGGQIVIAIGFLIALMAVIIPHAPVNLGTFNPAGPAHCRTSPHVAWQHCSQTVMELGLPGI